MSTITLSVAAFLIFTAAGVIWLNPRRLSNQAFSLVSSLLAVWLGCVYKAMVAGTNENSAEIIYWLKTSGVVTAFLPGFVWLQMEATIAEDKKNKAIIKKGAPWLLLAAFLCYLALHDTFARLDDDGGIARGTAYILYTTSAIISFSSCFLQTLGRLPHLKGIRKTELQFIGISIGGAALLLGLFNTLGNVLEIRAFNRASILIILTAYIIVTGALVFHRVFNARQIFTFLAQRTILAGAICIGIIYLPAPIANVVPSTAASATSILLSCAVGIWLNRVSSKWLAIDEESILAAARGTVIELAIKESNTDSRSARYQDFLMSSFVANKALLYFDNKDVRQKFPAKLEISAPSYHALCRAGWATPESLHRQRSSPELLEIKDFLQKHSLAVVVTVPKGSSTPSLIVALGNKTNDAPFTYPEVTRLQNIAELMDNVLTRSQLVAQSVMKARLEHLAMMSRGLAHDLKNLITPISSYLTHSAPHHRTGTLEAEVYRSAEKSLAIMNDFVQEALFFSEQMAPRYETVSLRRVFDEVYTVTASRAQSAGVRVSTNLHDVDSLKGDGVLILRLLINLVTNAIDASPPGETICLEAMTRGSGWLRLQVTDRGRGITPEHVNRIFDPYFTTKDQGEIARGFGLGLTITQKIVNLHNGKISVQSEPRKGSTISIDFPPEPDEAQEESARSSMQLCY